MNCQALVELVTAYLEGQLAPQDRERFEAHAESCPGCRAYIEQMRQTVRLIGKLHEDTLPPPMRDRLLTAFSKWKNQP
jgi:anti-sigma factor RsiW